MSPEEIENIICGHPSPYQSALDLIRTTNDAHDINICLNYALSGEYTLDEQILRTAIQSGWDINGSYHHWMSDFAIPVPFIVPIIERQMYSEAITAIKCGADVHCINRLLEIAITGHGCGWGNNTDNVLKTLTVLLEAGLDPTLDLERIKSMDSEIKSRNLQKYQKLIDSYSF